MQITTYVNKYLIICPQFTHKSANNIAKEIERTTSRAKIAAGFGTSAVNKNVHKYSHICRMTMCSVNSASMSAFTY